MRRWQMSSPSLWGRHEGSWGRRSWGGSFLTRPVSHCELSVRFASVDTITSAPLHVTPHPHPAVVSSLAMGGGYLVSSPQGGQVGATVPGFMMVSHQ